MEEPVKQPPRHEIDPAAMIYSGGPCPICGKETLITRRLTSSPSAGLEYRESTDCGCDVRRQARALGS